MDEQKSFKKLAPLLERMAQLNSEASALSAEINEHLRRRADATWPADPSALLEDDEATA